MILVHVADGQRGDRDRHHGMVQIVDGGLPQFEDHDVDSVRVEFAHVEFALADWRDNVGGVERRC